MKPESNKPLSMRTYADFATCDGKATIVVGTYRSLPRPRKGPIDSNAASDRAVIVLDDDNRIFLESLDEPSAKRPQKEREQFEGRRVRVMGIFHKFMPSRGEGLLAPSLSGISEIELED